MADLNFYWRMGDYALEAWRNTAEFVSKYFKNGSRIEVSGPLTMSTFEKNGEKMIQNFDKNGKPRRFALGHNTRVEHPRRKNGKDKN